MGALCRKVLGAVALLALAAGEVDAATLSVAYTYDVLGRVATAVYSNGVCITYSHDASGNRTSQTNSNCGGGATPTWGVGTWGVLPWTASQSGALDRPSGHGLAMNARASWDAGAPPNDRRATAGALGDEGAR